MANADAIPNLRRSIRNDKMRSLFDQAIAAGWAARRDGRGHIRLSPPDGGPFLSMSGTSNGLGRSVQNAEATFKRWLRQQEARPVSNPTIEKAIDRVETDQALDALGVKHGKVPVLPEADEPEPEPVAEQADPMFSDESHLWTCPECGDQMKPQGSGAHRAMHQRQQAARPARAGSGDLFTIEDVLSVAEFAGSGGLVEVTKLGEGLRLVAAMRGGNQSG